MNNRQLVTNWTAKKIKAGDVIPEFNGATSTNDYRLVIDVTQETEVGSLITSLPIHLSKNLLVRKIQIKSLKAAFK